MVRGRTDPFVVRFVEDLVDEGDVQPSVDPVDAVIGEQEESICLLVLAGMQRLIRTREYWRTSTAIHRYRGHRRACCSP